MIKEGKLDAYKLGVMDNIRRSTGKSFLAKSRTITII